MLMLAYIHLVVKLEPIGLKAFSQSVSDEMSTTLQSRKAGCEHKISFQSLHTSRPVLLNPCGSVFPRYGWMVSRPGSTRREKIAIKISVGRSIGESLAPAMSSIPSSSDRMEP